jgi:serine/threonine-protein kinase
MPDLVGQSLGQYHILDRIARGATSTVYKAYQEKLDRYVAIKVLSPHFVDEEGFLERFHQEARAVARLDHPNILPVYDFDQVGDTVFIVMKYVTSGTLRDLMHGPMETRLVMELATQIGLALGYAHRQGVIHRDVKPGNILIADDHWALLTDFGLAKIRATGRHLTASGMGVGTPDYMAPEQAQGQPVDGRTDLYSLGVMAYEMLTGRLPFDAESGMAVVVKHITEPPRPLRELCPEIPAAVERVILKSLEKNPDDRYPTAEAMIAALARAVGPQPDGVVKVTGAAAVAPSIEIAIASDGPSRWRMFTSNIAQRGATLRTRAQQGFDRGRAKLRSFTTNRPARRRLIAIIVGIMILLLFGLTIVPGALRSASSSSPTPTVQAAPIAMNTLQSSTATARPLPTSTPTISLTITVTPTSPATITPVAGMVAIPAGSFTMGAVSGKYDLDETPPHVVTLNTFYIDTVEVTNAQFARFASATGYKTEAEKAGDSTTWRNSSTDDRQRFPVTYVSWNDAVSYCRWVGKRLPTEAEWEKAARGNTKRIYPWGNTFDGKFANTVDLGAGQPVAVATNSKASPYGAYDMVGNVWEWVQDWYGAYSPNTQANPKGPGADIGKGKVIRGGSFKTQDSQATTTTRGNAGVDNRGDDIGFRCAK